MTVPLKLKGKKHGNITSQLCHRGQERTHQQHSRTANNQLTYTKFFHRDPFLAFIRGRGSTKRTDHLVTQKNTGAIKNSEQKITPFSTFRSVEN